MAKQLFANFASCYLGAAIVTTGAIANITLETGQGAEFPSPTAGDWFVLAIWKADKSALELFKITGRTGDVLTVTTRAFDGTTAATWSTSDICLCVANAGAWSDLQAAIATLQADLDTAEADIVTLEGNVATLQSTITQKPRMDIGTKTLFHQAAAPTGWTQDTGVNDRVIRVTSGTGAGTGGSWTISGVTVNGHSLSVAELPSHTHDALVESGGGFNRANSGTGTFGTGASAATGSGSAHSHGLTADGAWRPAYTDVIVCSRAS